ARGHRLIDSRQSARGVVAARFDVPRLPCRRHISHFHHRPALLGALNRHQKIRDRDRRENTDDRHDDQQLEQSETPLLLAHAMTDGKANTTARLDIKPLLSITWKMSASKLERFSCINSDKNRHTGCGIVNCTTGSSVSSIDL